MNRKKEISKDLSMIIDGLLMGVCLWISYSLRSKELVRLDLLSEIPPFSQAYWMLAVIVPGTPLLLDLQEFYDQPLSQKWESVFRKILRSGFWVVLLISISSIFGRLEVPSRSVLILFAVLAPMILMVRVGITRKILLHHYLHGKLGERSVLVGTDADAEDFLRGLSSAERLELQITQRFDLQKLDVSVIRKSIRQHAAGRVIFVSPDHPKTGDLPASCEAEGIDIWFVTQSFHGITAAPSLERSGKNRVLVFRQSPASFWYRFIKRFLDIACALFGLILLSPACLVIAVTIKLTSPGPVIFRQVRSGKRGKRFTILKFRSMVVNAPELHTDLLQKNEMQGPVFKISKDPRVTSFGAFLRRTSLDEIPQLVNVLRGEMTLVGPRPLPDYETDLIEKSTHRRRLSVKPGLTCLWQISGRNAIKSFEDWVQLDIEYIDRASLPLDLWIILRTVPVVLFRRGAH